MTCDFSLCDLRVVRVRPDGRPAFSFAKPSFNGLIVPGFLDHQSAAARPRFDDRADTGKPLAAAVKVLSTSVEF
jgi:hypothetical protein